MSELLDQTLWRPPERLTPSAWAEAHRTLTRQESGRFGAWRNDATPYSMGIMDLAASPGVTELVIRKAAQIGASEAVRNVIGWSASLSPDPMLLVLPSEETGRKIVSQRILPLFLNTPALARLSTDSAHDLQRRSVVLANGFRLTLGWSGSAASLASDPCRRVVLDEVDKYADWSGVEGSPIDLARVRTQSYGSDRLVVAISTPTTRDGYISALFDASDVKLYYWCACTTCDHWQRLSWPQVRWEAAEDADALRLAATLRPGLVWYECEKCRGKLYEPDRRRMVRKGVWATEAAAARLGFAAVARGVGGGGVVRSDWPPGSRVAVQISALYCLWVGLHETAAEFLRSKGSPQKMLTFTTQWLGEPFETVSAAVAPGAFDERSRAAGVLPGGHVPQWAQILIATADVQQDRIYWVVRAWAHGFRSARVSHGMTATFDDLLRLTLGAAFPVMGGSTSLRVDKLGIDCGFRRDDVFRVVLSNPAQIVALRGETEHRPGTMPIRIRRGTYRAPGDATADQPVWVHRIDTDYYKDQLASAIAQTIADVNPQTGEVLGQVPLWSLNAENDPDYNRQLASERKVLVRKGKAQAWKWEKVTAGAANHYLDCENYQRAMADIVRLETFPPPQFRPPTPVSHRPPAPRQTVQRNKFRRNYG